MGWQTKSIMVCNGIFWSGQLTGVLGLFLGLVETIWCHYFFNLHFIILWSLHPYATQNNFRFSVLLYSYLAVIEAGLLAFTTVFVDTRLSKTKHPRKRFQNFRQSCMLSTDRIEIRQSQPLVWPSDLLYVMLAGCDWWISMVTVVILRNKNEMKCDKRKICSEDDLRSRILGTFVVKCFACLPLLGSLNI